MARQIMNFAKRAFLQRVAIAELAVGTNKIAAQECSYGFNMGNNSSGNGSNYAGNFGNNYNTGYGKSNMGRSDSGQNKSGYKSAIGPNYNLRHGENFGQGSNFGNF